jgi:hypothetical protein
MRFVRKAVHWVGLAARMADWEGLGGNSRWISEPEAVERLQVGGTCGWWAHGGARRLPLLRGHVRCTAIQVFAWPLSLLLPRMGAGVLVLYIAPLGWPGHACVAAERHVSL